ncbi:hypothetical protein D7207_30510 [Burkholderia cepacia]|nr:hypothetical protein [Burkholderia cepacia]MBA9978130.1 hypothetical protein [Burkholderia cepacia]MBB0004694.1 hypothetical protein [Burkholderia cepacia]MBB0012604.1 hypothetical protein [Burkholderia cepacia]MBB0049375.1 hypothetical protein [Burkholderia cepacia]
MVPRWIENRYLQRALTVITPLVRLNDSLKLINGLRRTIGLIGSKTSKVNAIFVCSALLYARPCTLIALEKYIRTIFQLRVPQRHREDSIRDCMAFILRKFIQLRIETRSNRWDFNFMIIFESIYRHDNWMSGSTSLFHCGKEDICPSLRKARR